MKIPIFLGVNLVTLVLTPITLGLGEGNWEVPTFSTSVPSLGASDIKILISIDKQHALLKIFSWGKNS